MREPVQTAKNVKSITPISPITGCHIGIVTGVAIRVIISMGVKGGNNERPVEKLLIGFFSMGMITKRGSIMGIIAGKLRFCASLLSLHAAPRAVNSDPIIIRKKSRYIKNHATRAEGTRSE
jgi:hypothetical protein